MLTKIDHVNIVVTDLTAAVKFFTDLLGFSKITGGTLTGDWIDKVVGLQNVQAEYVQLGIPNTETKLELIQYHNPVSSKNANINQANTVGLRHLAFTVQDIEAVYEKLKANNVEMVSELQTYNQKKKLCYFIGPDDVILEICEYGNY